MSTAVQLSLGTAVLGCAGIMIIGARFLLSPQRATTDFGVNAGDVRALTAIKGVRDITSGIVPLVVWRVAGRQAFGWAMVAAACTPMEPLSSVGVADGRLLWAYMA